jgi:hypothetical protein
VEQKMKMIVINNDAANTVISVNSLNFQIMVSDLTEEVYTYLSCSNTSAVLNLEYPYPSGYASRSQGVRR